MEENTENEQTAFEEFNKFYSYTDEDLARVMTEEELKELCLRLKCRVEMDRWNPVYDMQRSAKKQGRLKNKSQKKEINFLAKCVNRYKPECLYSEQEIRSVNIEEWRQRKKFNILRLDLWKYDRENAQSCSQTDSDIMEVSAIGGPNKIQQQLEAYKLKLNDLISNSMNEDAPECFMSDYLDINTESIEVGTQSMCINSQDRTEVLVYPSQDNLGTQPLSGQPLYGTQDILSAPQTEYSEFNARVPCSSTQDTNLLINS